MPHVEDGTIVLIGATTENPSFHVNNALLSRCRVITLEKLSSAHITTILKKTLGALGISTRYNDDKEGRLESTNLKNRYSILTRLIKIFFFHSLPYSYKHNVQLLLKLIYQEYLALYIYFSTEIWLYCVLKRNNIIVAFFQLKWCYN